MVTWEVDVELIKIWFSRLDINSRAQVQSAIELLESEGPQLGRPLVDSVNGSAHKNMKELRPGSSGRSELRILFVFDPDRKAIMLVAGDKSGTWSKWYRTSIRKADQLYTEHVEKRKQAQ
ncbi:MAG: type II toxin-antitoxin system RelE/ParE family toxin [Aurantimicrobium sp.]